MLYEFDERLLKQTAAPPRHQPSRRHPIVIQNDLCKANVSSKLGDNLQRHILVVEVLVEVTVCAKVKIFLEEKERQRQKGQEKQEKQEMISKTNIANK